MKGDISFEMNPIKKPRLSKLDQFRKYNVKPIDTTVPKYALKHDSDELRAGIVQLAHPISPLLRQEIQKMESVMFKQQLHLWEVLDKWGIK